MTPNSRFKAAAGPPQSSMNPPSASLFSGGSNFLITGGSFVQNNIHNSTTAVLKPLYDMVSPNAILNAGGRADPVKCYPGTREEVIARIEKWHRADHRKGHPIFWLSGPAGAGKSAIVQTIAERCTKYNMPMVNFFFFRADATRNHSESLVATLLFQLIQLFPELKVHVADIVADDSVILRQSTQTQFSVLIEPPLRIFRQVSGHGPPIMLIDGLDECAKAEQVSLLHILHDIATMVDPMFAVLVASRNEAHLTMAFNRIGASPHSIYLDESYRPQDDIRLFLSEEFSRIRRTHRLGSTLDNNWPLPADFNSILNKSSGQFVYAATVIRFIATFAASPQRSLEIVLGLRPITKTSPFVTLDSLYTYILSQAEDWESVKEILAAQKVSSLTAGSLIFTLSPLGYTEDDVLSDVSDLMSIIQFEPGDQDLTIFHASLGDFLYDKSRAGEFYVDVNMFACKLAPLHFKQVVNNMENLRFCFDILRSVTRPDESLHEFLSSYAPDPEIFARKLNFPPTDESDDLWTHAVLHLARMVIPQTNNFIRARWMDTLAILYESQDPLFHKNIATRWQEWFCILYDAEESGPALDRRTLKPVPSTSENDALALAYVKYDLLRFPRK